PLPAGGVKDNDPFQPSSRLDPKPDAPKPDAKPAALPPPLPVAAVPHAPPLAAEPTAAKAEPTLNPAPVELPSAGAVHVAPPLVEKSHEEAPGKLAQPHLPDSGPEAASLKMPEVGPIPQAPEMPKAPELKKAEPTPPKPAEQAPPLPVGKGKDKEKLKKSAPIILATTTRIPIPGAGEGRPALRPAVLPSRLRTAPETPAPETAPPAEITAKAAPGAEPAPKIEPENKPETKASEPDAKTEPPKAESKIELPVNKPLGENEAAAVAAKSVAVTTGAAALASHKKQAPPLPPTRAERAKKRRLRGVIVFWVLFPFVALGLFFGILYFGRDTRVEGQVIPPQGMSLADEVWIVSDFTSLASGVADDVAKERVPLQLAIQEAQDHVQRVQADIGSREERIRLIQDNIQAAKDDITNAVKKSQIDAQAVYDGQGKELDDEYNSRMGALKQAIGDRAASLKLNYQPDPAFPSPEVWANAYRLALYETPAGVDGVKEHQWIADQMKAWRDFEKSMDDHYQQMREQAATVKQANGPHIADVNAKIDDLNGRIQATQQEEDPLKAELTQAQKDLADAQAAEAGLDEKYFGQLDALPAENISYHIPLRPDGRFTWVPDNPFGEGEIEHHYVLFSRAIRADGRQYWSLHEFTMKKNETTEITLEPTGFESTKQILRPNLSPEEIEQ
ncbi:MAG TPA: hypothetical protein VHY09_01665, partial [Candidatus Methylacidiphilales bacterium]|nr:hypothetical protein [Candidatus Methylacidiphilales bacterium]